MKKLAAISILLTFLTAAAFAQFKASVTAEFQTDILRTAAPLDNAKDTSKADPLFTGDNSGPGVPNTITGYNKRYTNFLGSMNYWNGSELKLNLSYTDPDNKDDPKYGGLLQLKVDGLWDALISKGRTSALYGFTGTDNPTFLDIVAAPFGDWNVWGRVGIFKGFVGNTDNRGATAAGRYAHYNDYMDRFKFENLGIMKMAGAPGSALLRNGSPDEGAITRGLLVHDDVDMSDLRSSIYDGDSVYASVEATLAPITVAAAADLSGIKDRLYNPTLNQFDYSNDTIDSHTAIGAAFRISGDVLDMLKFDAVYKITGGERITDENQGTNASAHQPDNNGDWTNRFGLFGNVNLLNDTLGLTLGYSGEFRVRENTGTAIGNSPDGVDRNYVYPYYNGVDLRAHFSGIDRLKVSFNNNFSFSTTKGRADNTLVMGILTSQLGNVGGGYALTHSEMTEGYFGMYNALLADFNLTDDLLLSFQVGNRLYAYNYTNKADGADAKADITMDELQLAAGAFYSLGSHVTLGSGLAFNLTHATVAIKGIDDYKAGIFTFGIPLTVKVVY